MSDDNSILKEDDTQNKVFSVDEKPLLEIRVSQKLLVLL